MCLFESILDAKDICLEKFLLGFIKGHNGEISLLIATFTFSDGTWQQNLT